MDGSAELPHLNLGLAPRAARYDDRGSVYPQTWSAYAYVATQPLSMGDPLGLQRCATHSGRCMPALHGSGGADDSLFGPNPDWDVLALMSAYPIWVPDAAETSALCVQNCADGLTAAVHAPEGQGCGGILARGAGVTALDAVALIPIAGNIAAAFYGGKDAFESVRLGAALGSTGISIVGSDGFGASLSLVGIGAEIKSIGEAIPVAGKAVAIGAVGWDLFSMARDYLRCVN